jgi:hypothetical protein
MGDSASCMRCGRELPKRRLKEVVYEEGRTRVRDLLCPNCLDEIMNTAQRVRGVVGTEKHAAIHIDPGPGSGERESFGERATNS